MAGSIVDCVLGTGRWYVMVVCREFRSGPESGMLQPGWWPSWWTSILLSDAYRRGEASEGVDGRAESETERRRFFWSVYIDSVILAALAYSSGDESDKR